MPKKSSPDYVKKIVLALAGILILIIILLITDANLQVGTLNYLANNLNANSSNGKLVANNLVTTWAKQTLTAPKINPDSPILGPATAPVTIFEFSSFGCPYSASIQPVIAQILKKYPTQVKLVWKDLPTEAVYTQALPAHLAAYCAGKQGKFWAYSDLLWQNQKDFSAANLKKLAQDLKLDQKKFDLCFGNKDGQQTVSATEQEASDLLIPGTPHFYINSQELLGVATFEDFDQLVQAELSRKK